MPHGRKLSVHLLETLMTINATFSIRKQIKIAPVIIQHSPSASLPHNVEFVYKDTHTHFNIKNIQRKSQFLYNNERQGFWELNQKYTRRLGIIEISKTNPSHSLQLRGAGRLVKVLTQNP